MLFKKRNKLLLVKIKWSDNIPYFVVKDPLHLTQTTFDVRSIDNKNIIENFNSYDSFLIGRVLNSYYASTMIYDKAEVMNNGSVNLYSSSSPHEPFTTNLKACFEVKDILMNCSFEVIKLLSSEKQMLEQKLFLDNINSFNDNEKSVSNIISLQKACDL